MICKFGGFTEKILGLTEKDKSALDKLSKELAEPLQKHRSTKAQKQFEIEQGGLRGKSIKMSRDGR